MLTPLKKLLASFWPSKPRRMHSLSPDNQAYISELTFAGVVSSEMAVTLKRHVRLGEYWLEQSIHDFKEREYTELSEEAARSIIAEPAELVHYVSHPQQLKERYIASLKTNVLTRHLSVLKVYFLEWRILTFNFLQPGLQPDAITTAFSSVDLVPTLELRELYGWKNGVFKKQETLLRDIQLIPGFYLISIEDSISVMKTHQQRGTDIGNLFPLLVNERGDFYAADLSKPSEKNASCKIVKFTASNSNVSDSYDSFELMMRTFVACCNEGIITTDDGNLIMDATKHAVVAHRIGQSAAQS